VNRFTRTIVAAPYRSQEEIDFDFAVSEMSHRPRKTRGFGTPHPLLFA